MIHTIKAEALKFAEPERVNMLQKFFQVYKGGYGYGDSFAGIRNPVLRSLAKKYKAIPLSGVEHLLTDSLHEIRLLALFILQIKFEQKKVTEQEREAIVNLYLKNLDFVNNWDLVDSSAFQILGKWEYIKGTSYLRQLALSPNLWYNRIAMIGCFAHIKNKSYDLPLNIAKTLLSNPNDIIHKAVGWMLREIGNRNLLVEEQFLQSNYHQIPRTVLRYAIEKFDEPRRILYLKGSF